MNAPGVGNAEAEPSALTAVAEIVVSYVGRNQVPPSELPGLILAVHAAMASLGTAPLSGMTRAEKPAVPIKKSVNPDYIVCLEDGRKLTMLKRYLRTTYDLSPEQYRAKWGLPPDYPMVAPNYAKRRSEFAKKIGLGKTAKPGAGRKRGGAGV